MKRLFTIALVLVLTLSLFTGCRSRQEDNTGDTGMDTTAGQNDMLPNADEIVPDANDRVDPTNGANRDDNDTTGSTANDATNSTADSIIDDITGTTNETTGTENTNRSRRRPMQ